MNSCTKGNKNKVADIEQKKEVSNYMLQIKRERKIRPYKKRKRIKEKKIELHKKEEK